MTTPVTSTVPPPPCRPFRIALTGGIASGKSTVSAELRRLGAPVIDADEIARDVVAPGSPALAEIVAEFNRRNPVRLTLTDAKLAGQRLSATFRSDNVEGFVRLMESDFGMKAEWRADDEIVLTRVP